MLDYLKWRGDLPFTLMPFCEIDALVFSQLAYLHFRDAQGCDRAPLATAAARVEALPREGGNAQVVAERHALLLQVAESARFSALDVWACEDLFAPQLEMQFAAATFTLPDGAHVLAYRGTDATVVGWREDFNMSFACPVPSQTEALRYLTRVAGQASGSLILCGHSKGGNLALYAAACCSSAIRERIQAVYLFDAPGLNAETVASAGYQAALPAVRCYVPQTSVIGRLMAVPEAYTVVRSNAFGIGQHNVFTWALDGARFATLPALDYTSKIIKTTLDDFLLGSTPVTRQLFVDTLFSILGAANTHTLGELTERWTGTASALFSAVKGIDPGTRKAVLSVVGSLASSGVESAMRWLHTDREVPPNDPPILG